MLSFAPLGLISRGIYELYHKNRKTSHKPPSSGCNLVPRPHRHFPMAQKKMVI